MWELHWPDFHSHPAFSACLAFFHTTSNTKENVGTFTHLTETFISRNLNTRDSFYSI
jgi:hypothetical protein